MTDDLCSFHVLYDYLALQMGIYYWNTFLQYFMLPFFSAKRTNKLPQKLDKSSNGLKQCSVKLNFNRLLILILFQKTSAEEQMEHLYHNLYSLPEHCMEKADSAELFGMTWEWVNDDRNTFLGELVL